MTAGTRVLLIEDDPGDVYLLRRMLAEASARRIELEPADLLAKGLALLAEGGFDVLLVDLDLPDSSGLATFQTVRRRAPDLPVIVLSGLDDETVALVAVREGAQDYLVKGQFEGQLLVRSIRYAIERHRLQQSLRDLSLRDDLTGLYNCRGLTTLADQQVKMARRRGSCLLLAFADLDGLKEINDTHGHSVGNEAITATARVLRETFRDSDIVARFGGDEFVVLLPETEARDFEVPARRLANRVAAFNREATRPFTLSLSLGIATWDPRQPGSLEQLIERADQAMYEEKRRKLGDRGPHDATSRA